MPEVLPGIETFGPGIGVNTPLLNRSLSVFRNSKQALRNFYREVRQHPTFSGLAIVARELSCCSFCSGSLRSVRTHLPFPFLIKSSALLYLPLLYVATGASNVIILGTCSTRSATARWSRRLGFTASSCCFSRCCPLEFLERTWPDGRARWRKESGILGIFIFVGELEWWTAAPQNPKTPKPQNP